MTVLSLTHWGRATHICVGKLTIIGSDNGLSPGRCQAIIGTNAGILLIWHQFDIWKVLIWPLGTNFSEILIEIQTFSLTKIRLKMSSAKLCSFRIGLNVLTWESPYLGKTVLGGLSCWKLWCCIQKFPQIIMYASPGSNGPTHLHLDKMIDIEQTTFSNAFSWTKKL